MMDNGKLARIFRCFGLAGIADALANVECLLIDNRTGRVIDRRETHNIMTNLGKAARALILSSTGTVAQYIGTGTGTTTPAATDVALVTPVGTRVSGTKSRVTVTVTNDTYQVVATNSYSSAYAITEAGLFEDGTTGSTAWCRNVFAALNVDANTSIQTTWKITLS